MDSVIISIAFLGVAILTDYLHTAQISPISSAIPCFVFNLLYLANEKVKQENDGRGIVQLIMDKLRRN